MIRLNEKYVKKFISQEEMSCMDNIVRSADKILRERTGAGNDYLGWLDLPYNYDKNEFERIKITAQKIRKMCDIFIVVGIGGSYLGARAVIEFLKSNMHNRLNRDMPEIYFAGNNISAAALSELIEICEGKDVCINVISKSGKTTEPAIAFRVLRGLLEKKYGADGCRERIYITTDREKGNLKPFADKAGFETFVVPDNVGGRFSVLTPVGLLPIAVAGIDIDKLMSGAAKACIDYAEPDIDKNDCYRYAALRNILYRKGKVTEILVGYEQYLQMFSEWWKQLYGESEGKDQKGIYPSSVIFSTDLHSLGQYIQDGLRNQFETVISIKTPDVDVIIPDDPADIDGLNFVSGMTLNYVNSKAMQGTLLAHIDGGVPNIVIEVDKRDEENLGYLIYFFELGCAISGYMLGVNPFNQPGVESYKKNMFALLGKPGLEKEKAELENRLI